MSKYTWLDAAKDFLGALGPVLIAIPWFRDFFGRLKRANFSGVRASGNLEKLKSEIEEILRKKVEHPRTQDFGWTVAGLACITASFIIAFALGLPDLFGP